MSVPEFGDIGKVTKDLFSKDYILGKTKLEIKSVSDNHVVDFYFFLFFMLFSFLDPLSFLT